MTTAWADCTEAPQAQRSEQACKAVMRPLTQGSLISAGKPSTLCSSGAFCPSASVGITAASSGAFAKPPTPAEDRAASRVAAGSLAAQPRQSIGSPSALASALLMAEAWKRCMKRRSMRCFQRQSSGWGPSMSEPQRAQAVKRSPWNPPISCSAFRWGVHGRRGWF